MLALAGRLLPLDTIGALAVHVDPVLNALDKPPARHCCLVVLVRLGRAENNRRARAADAVAVTPLETFAVLFEAAVFGLAAKLDAQEPVALRFRVERSVHVGVEFNALDLTDTGAGVL